jgi:hypothetical protein
MDRRQRTGLTYGITQLSKSDIRLFVPKISNLAAVAF